MVGQTDGQTVLLLELLSGANKMYDLSYLGVHNAQGIRVGKLVQSTQPPGETMLQSIEQN